MIEYINILYYLFIYNNYNKYINTLNINTIDNKELSYLYKCLEELHSTYKKDICLEEFTMYAMAHCPEKMKEPVEALLRGLEGSQIDDQLVGDILTTIRNKKLAYDLALVSLEVSEGRSSVDEIFSTIDQFDKQQASAGDALPVISTNLEELYNESVRQPGLRWRLKTLNKMLGSLRKGNFGFIFARPETGKTTFLASEVTNFLGQLTAIGPNAGPILWFNNEERGDKVMLRCIQSSLGVTRAELFSDIEGHQRAFESNGGSLLRLYDSASIHRRQVEQLCQELNPSLIVFDQLDKIKGFVDDREDLRLGAIYIWARELAKQYCPVIAVCQADATGEGKRWLTMENVANAKTAKQAEADWILGIGKTHDASMEYVRHLHLSKNKLDGDEDTDPELRHGKADVIIEPNIARYRDVEYE